MQHGARRKPDRVLILTLAARAEVDTRTAERALVEGPHAIRGMPGERCARVLRDPSFTGEATHH